MGIESNTGNENFSSALFRRIEELLDKSLEHYDKTGDETFSNELVQFNDQLLNIVKERFTEGDWFAVPEWHKLVGSTPEYHEIDEESRTFILSEIESFVKRFEDVFAN